MASFPDWLNSATVLTVLVSKAGIAEFCLIPVVILRTRQPLAAVA